MLKLKDIDYREYKIVKEFYKNMEFKNIRVFTILFKIRYYFIS